MVDLGDSAHVVAVDALDWAIVAVYLTVSVSVGLYCGRKSQGGDSDEYLLAGKGMNGFVVAISSLGGSYSAVSLIGSSGWAFVDGMAATTAGFLVAFPSAILTAEVWVPIYRGLPNVVSCYQFLETRFSLPVRTLVSIIGNFSVLCYISVVLYAPALAISSIVPGLGIFETIFFLGIVTSGYTVYGGMHAVVWTDFVQTWALATLLGALFFKAIQGLGSQGMPLGPLDVLFLNWGLPDITSSVDHHWPSFLRMERPFWQLLHDKHKLLDDFFWGFHLELPLVKGAGTQVNVWGYFVGLVLNVPCGQNQIQRWLTCRDDRELKRSIYWGLFIGLCFPGIAAIGVLIYSNYALRCERGETLDPLACAIATVNATTPVPPLHGNSDRILGYFALHELPNGFAGGLLAVLFASAMSVFSGNLNSIATCLVLDGSRCIGKNDLDSPTTVRLVRRATWLVGFASMGLACVFVSVGGILRINTALSGLLSGSPGVFLLGMTTTRANYQGALCGLLSSIVLAAYLLISQQPCPTTKPAEECDWIWRGGHLSFFFYGPAETLCTFIVGYLSSYFWPAPSPPQVQGMTIWTRQTAGWHAGRRGVAPEEQPLLGEKPSIN